MTDMSFLEVPDDPPRLANRLIRRISALVVDCTKCVHDPRTTARDNATERELDFLIGEGLVQVLGRRVLEDAADEQASSNRSFAADEVTLDRFSELVSRLGDVKIRGANQIVMPNHDFVGDSRWFPDDRFVFDRPFNAKRVADANQAGGPQAVVRLIADSMYERTAAQLATLQTIAANEGTELVSSSALAPMLRAIEDSTRGEAPSPDYISAGADLLITTILRHSDAIEGLAEMTIEEVVDLSRRLSEPRRGFQKLLRTYADEIARDSEPETNARRVYRKYIEPEVEAFDAAFGSVFRTVRSYAKGYVGSPTALIVLPLAALGMTAGLNTAWTLAVHGAYSAAETRKRSRAWPRILFELRFRESQR